MLKKAGLQIPDYIDIQKHERPIRHVNEYWDHYGIQVHHGLHLPGDLIFFTRNGYFPTHVGIVRDAKSYIHSPGRNNTEVEMGKIIMRHLDFELPEGSPRIIFNTNIIGYKSPTLPIESDNYRFLQQSI